MRAIVASKNPVKLKTAQVGFERMFPGEGIAVEGVSVSSGVADQPMSDAETFQGSLQRVVNARQAAPDANYWVGIEGGLEEKNGELEAFAWVVVQDAHGKTGKGRTSAFFLPSKVAELVRQGKELGEADDIVFGLQNSKQQMGAVGILTKGVIDRAQYYEQAMIVALIPFKNPELY